MDRQGFAMPRLSVGLRAAMVSLALAGWPGPWAVTANSAQETQQIWTVPEIGALPNKAYSRLVRRGRDLITATYAHIGP
jgi:thiosulfate dehydrogenase